MPISFGAAVLCTIPKLSMVPFVMMWVPQPLDILYTYPWPPMETANAMIGEVSVAAWMTCLYLFATLVALAAMTGGLRFASVGERRLAPWVTRFSRVTLWALFLSITAWFALSTLIQEPIRLLQPPHLFDPFSYHNAWVIR
jgi:hypothetical protein